MTQKICYYELLEVEKDCNALELKKAYRNASLKFHPDKCKDIDAKDKMILINEAYEVLSDPNQRSWYDNHRTQILSGKDTKNEEDTLEASFGGLNIKKYQSNCFNGFSDEKGAFYQVYRDLFENIKSQEFKAYQQGQFDEIFVEYPGFGDSTTSPYLVYEFYSKWENFSSYKNFSWADEYRADDENRYVKRCVERENNKFRVKERKNYIETIKKILQFIIKKGFISFLKDTRYQAYEKMLEEEQEKKKKYKEQEKLIKEKEIKEMRKQQREIEQKRLQEEEELIKKGLKVIENQDQFQHIQQDEELPDFYCQVCDKEYKSQKALESHKNSKQHKKNLKDLMEQVGTNEEIQKNETKQNETNILKENNILNEKNIKNEIKQNEFQQKEVQIEEPEQFIQQKQKNKKNKKNLQFLNQDKKLQPKFSFDEQEKQQEKKTQKLQEQDDEEIDISNLTNNKQKKQDDDDQDEIDITQLISNKSKKGQEVDDHEINMDNLNNQKKKQVQDEIQQIEKPKDKDNKKKDSKVQLAQQGEIDINELSKAKQKKLKKLQQEQQEAESKFKCKKCKETFTSKTKLFKHFDENKSHIQP